MREQINKYLGPKGITYALVLLVAVAFYFIMLRWDTVSLTIKSVLAPMAPFFLGFVFAYLLSGVVRWCERKPFHNIKSAKIKRVLAITIAMIFAFAVVTLLFMLVVPQLVDNLMLLGSNLTQYISSLQTTMEQTIQKFDIDPMYTSQIYEWFESFQNRIIEIAGESLPYLLGVMSTAFSKLSTTLIAIFITVYYLASKETLAAQLKKLLYANISSSKVERLLEVATMANKTFSGFISGKLLDSLIIGIICFVGMKIFHFDYALLISTIVGVTNIIPFFGPFIGAIPSAIILLVVDPIQSIWFLVFVLALQQLDGNVIGPKILGDSTGLPLLWVMFAILVGGGLFGFIGMILGVPTFAVFYNLLKMNAERKLKNKNMPIETADYRESQLP